jgi:dCMP deaminase
MTTAQIQYFERLGDPYEFLKEQHLEGKQRVQRPSWDEYFLQIANLTAKRSPDAQTQCGCVITLDNRILGTGYNGYPAGIDDSILANTRPLKYPWFLHSEINAIHNCTIKPINGTAYITGLPCLPCLLNMWQAGIRRVVTGKQASFMRDTDTEYEMNVRLFLEACKNQIKIEVL